MSQANTGIEKWKMSDGIYNGTPPGFRIASSVQRFLRAGDSLVTHVKASFEIGVFRGFR